ncbi:MAG: hypothetical protein IPO92_10350 [Saprospiraceae bacterium]|nr:hypothetical protein [Saprospiraceae bacterium]
MDDKKVNSKTNVDNSGSGYIRQTQSDLIFTIEDVLRGSHTFKVIHEGSVTSCDQITVLITKSEEFKYKCEFSIIN